MSNPDSFFMQILESQNYKCAICGKKITLKKVAKKTHSFELICQECYDTPSKIYIVEDEVAKEEFK